MEKKHDYFISYSNADAALAFRIYRDLLQLGLKVYLYEKRGEKGEDFWKTIMEKIGHADRFCLLDSPNARKSKWVIRECAYGMHLVSKGIIKKFIPCLLEINGPWRNTVFFDLIPEDDIAADSRTEIGDRIFLKEEEIRRYLNRTAGVDVEKTVERSRNSELFKKINAINGIDLFGFTRYDAEEIYQDGLRIFCASAGKAFRNITGGPDEKDFEKELLALDIFDEDKKNNLEESEASLNTHQTDKEILLNDFRSFVRRHQSSFNTVKKRLELLKEECEQIGFILTDESIKICKKKGIPPKTIDKLSKPELKGQRRTTLADINLLLRKHLDIDEYLMYKHAILKSLEKGIRLFSLEFAIAFLQFEEGNYQQAYHTVKKIAPEFSDARAWNAKGRLESFFGNNKDAMTSQKKALAIIEKSPGDFYLQLNKVLVYHDLIWALTNLEECKEAERTLNKIEANYHILPDYKYAKVRIFLCREDLVNAERELNILFKLFAEEQTEWAGYQLTEQKLVLLGKKGIPAGVIGQLEELLNARFFSAKEFKLTLSGILGYTFSKYKDDLLNVARFDRGFNINTGILIDLEYKLFAALLKKCQLIPACEHLQRCSVMYPENLAYKSDLAMIYSVLGRANENLIEEGFFLDPVKKEDYYFYGQLYYLRKDYEKARLFYKQSGTDWKYYDQVEKDLLSCL